MNENCPATVRDLLHWRIQPLPIRINVDGHAAPFARFERFLSVPSSLSANRKPFYPAGLFFLAQKFIPTGSRLIIMAILLLKPFVLMAGKLDFKLARQMIVSASPRINYDTFCSEMLFREDLVTCPIKGLPSVACPVCQSLHYPKATRIVNYGALIETALMRLFNSMRLEWKWWRFLHCQLFGSSVGSVRAWSAATFLQHGLINPRGFPTLIIFDQK